MGVTLRAVAEYVLDPHDRAALRCAFDSVLPDSAPLTVYMCWHSGVGHDYPTEVLEAARRLRERHLRATDSGWDDYTSLSFVPSLEDRHDFLTVAPFCDLAYATDRSERLLASVSGEGTEAYVTLTAAQHALVLAQCPGANLRPVSRGASLARRIRKWIRRSS